MPEVKWVSRRSLYDMEVPGEIEVPVFTLDQIEAWLRECIENGYVNISQCVDDVQAMKEGTK